MAVIRCEKGHYYNNGEYTNCPYCSGKIEIGKTIPLGDQNGAGAGTFGNTEYVGFVRTVDVNANSEISETRPVEPENSGVTVIVDESKNSDVAPVRGWLVVVDGEKIGQDFRVVMGKNFVGRDKGSDICIDFDKSVSSKKACYIIYDGENNVFYIQDGESKNNTYVNKELLCGSRKLQDNDIIKIGKTSFIFRTLCNETFNYEVK